MNRIDVNWISTTLVTLLATDILGIAYMYGAKEPIVQSNTTNIITLQYRIVLFVIPSNKTQHMKP